MLTGLALQTVCKRVFFVRHSKHFWERLKPTFHCSAHSVRCSNDRFTLCLSTLSYMICSAIVNRHEKAWNERRVFLSPFIRIGKSFFKITFQLYNYMIVYCNKQIKTVKSLNTNILVIVWMVPVFQSFNIITWCRPLVLLTSCHSPISSFQETCCSISSWSTN